MNIGLHQVTDRRIHLPMPCNGSKPTKGLGHDPHAEMALAARGSRVSGMHVTLILDQ
jgi:hypothetical protein